MNDATSRIATWLCGTMAFWAIIHRACDSFIFFFERFHCCGLKSIKTGFKLMTGACHWCTSGMYDLRMWRFFSTQGPMPHAFATTDTKKCYWRRLVRSQVYYVGAGICGIYLVSQYPIIEYFGLQLVCWSVAFSLSCLLHKYALATGSKACRASLKWLERSPWESILICCYSLDNQHLGRLLVRESLAINIICCVLFTRPGSV